LGDNRPANPKTNDVWVTNAGVLEYYNGTAWVAYLSPPETGPDQIFQPGILEEAAPDDDEGPGAAGEPGADGDAGQASGDS
jgi:hypothetical protein